MHKRITFGLVIGIFLLLLVSFALARPSFPVLKSPQLTSCSQKIMKNLQTIPPYKTTSGNSGSPSIEHTYQFNMLVGGEAAAEVPIGTFVDLTHDQWLGMEMPFGVDKVFGFGNLYPVSPTKQAFNGLAVPNALSLGDAQIMEGTLYFLTTPLTFGSLAHGYWVINNLDQGKVWVGTFQEINPFTPGATC